MSNTKPSKIHLIYGWFLAILVVALGIALIVSCLDIYRDNPTGDPYSPATIGTHFHDIAILVYATLAAIVGGILLSLVRPMDSARPKAIRNEWDTMKKAARKAGAADPEYAALIQKEQNIRLGVMTASAVIFIALMIYPAIYLLNGSHFTGANPNAEIIKASLYTLSPALLGLLVCYAGGAVIRKSLQRQTGIYKKMAANNPATSALAEAPSKIGMVAILRWSVLAAAIVLIVIGIFNGSAKDVLDKAVKICTECIGLG